MLFDLLFPAICIGCKMKWSYLCAQCKKHLHPHLEICPITHRESPGYATRHELLTHPCPLDGCIVLFRFDALIRKLISQLKYYHRSHISNFLGERLTLALQTHTLFQELITYDSKLMISYVPSHRYRHYITKGYNQSKLLAKALASQLPPFNKGGQGRLVQQLCKKIKNTHSQVGMTREQRKTNNSDAFVCIAPPPPWSTIIIVDDVLTTGSTLIEMAKTIKKSQPDCQVWGLCIARNA